MRFPFPFTLAAWLVAFPALAAGPFVTVYSHDLGFVREPRTLEARSPQDTLRLEDISSRLDFSSVRLTPASGRVARLAYRWDVASGDGLIEHALGRQVRVQSRENHVSEGTLLSSDGGWLVLRGDDGSLSTLARNSVDAVQIAPSGAPLALKPAIEAVLEGAHGAVRAELSYLTGGLSWTAEHTLVRTGETTGIWSTRVDVENTTGRDFVNATLKLVAGEPSLSGGYVAKGMPMMMRAMDAVAAAPAALMTEAAFSEYHLYTLHAPATLRDRETQSLMMLDPQPITFAPRYLYRDGDAQGVLAQLEIVNSAKAGPGAPLPAGRVRTFQNDESGALQFIGERSILHTPVDEKVTIEVGYAFDVAAERKMTSEKRPSAHERQYAMELRLRNRKSVAMKIVIEESIGGDTEVVAESSPSVRKDATTLQWTLEVPAGKETVLTYSAHQHW